MSGSQLLTSMYKSNVHLHILAVLFVVGTFTRVTFVAFALPIGWRLLRQVFLPTSIRLRTSPWHNQALTLLLPSLTAALVSLAIILTDTYYFRGDFSTSVVTPLNFLSYNLSPKNLAEHGIHPRWLHLFVNLPMMVSPPLLWLAVRAGIQHWRIPAEKRAHANEVLDRSEP
jgi:GPI mannosyltransferase 4